LVYKYEEKNNLVCHSAAGEESPLLNCHFGAGK
jgi:hypothetical protein